MNAVWLYVPEYRFKSEEGRGRTKGLKLFLPVMFFEVSCTL